MSSNRALTFAREMLVNGDPIAAVRAAGYTGNKRSLQIAAKRLMQHKDVRDILETVSRKDVLVQAARESAVKEVKHALESREGRIAWLIEMIEGRVKEPRTVSVGDGMSEVEDTTPPAAARLAALKTLGSMYGDYVQRVQLDVREHTVFVIPDNGGGPLPPGAVVHVPQLPDRLSDAVSIDMPEDNSDDTDEGDYDPSDYDTDDTE
jgi:hypothetical protein